ncbi:hypothetical protein G3M48_007107, partial [Beauveria asiatica]
MHNHRIRQEAKAGTFDLQCGPGSPLPQTPNDDGVDCPEQPKFCPADEFLVSWQLVSLLRPLLKSGLEILHGKLVRSL